MQAGSGEAEKEVGWGGGGGSSKKLCQIHKELEKRREKAGRASSRGALAH